MTKEARWFRGSRPAIRDPTSDFRKVDVDKLVETHRKNFEALTQTALVASDGSKNPWRRNRKRWSNPRFAKL